MPHLARRSPTPAAVLTLVGLGVLTLTYWFLSWNDALDQDPEYAWPIDPATILRSSAGWTLTVLLVCAVVWAAELRQSRLGRPWRVPVTAATAVAAWSAIAWRSTLVSYRVDGWYVPWPGPVPASAFVNDPTDLYAPAALTVRPGALTPVVLVVAVAVVSWSARRYACALPSAPTAPRRGAYAVALGVLGAPVVAAVTAATLLQLDSDGYSTVLQQTIGAVVHPGAALAAAVVAALALGGTRLPGRVLLGLVGLTVVGPLVTTWWSGESDTLLASAALGVVAIALAAAVHPVATAVSRLDDTDPQLPELVPEGADADDRARA